MVATIRASTSSSSGKPPPNAPRVGWSEDFCDELAPLFRCKRTDFRTTPPGRTKTTGPTCAELMAMLNLFVVANNMGNPARSGKPFVAAMPNGSKEGIQVTPDAIANGSSKPVNIQTALEMALLAKANPAMAKSVKLEGTADELKILTKACELAGLTVENPSKLDPVKDKKFISKMENAWEALHDTAVAEAGKRSTGFRKKMIDNTGLSPAVSSVLAGVSTTLYQQAKEKVWTDQDTDMSKLQTAFSCSASDAETCVHAMVAEGLVQDIGSGKFEVCYNKEACWGLD